MGGVAALVAAMRFGASLGLLHRIDGDDAVADREAPLNRQVHQPTRALAADIVVVAGLAPDHTAQREEAVITLGGQRNRAWNLEGARHDHPLESGTVPRELALCAGDQGIGDLRVVAGFDHENARTLDAIDGRPNGRILRARAHSLPDREPLARS